MTPDQIAELANKASEFADTGLNYVGIASILAAMTKTQKDNKILSWVVAILQFVALNFKAAKAASQQKELVAVDKNTALTIKAQERKYNN